MTSAPQAKEADAKDVEIARLKQQLDQLGGLVVTLQNNAETLHEELQSLLKDMQSPSGHGATERDAAIAKMVKVAATQLWGDGAAERVTYSVRYGDEAAAKETDGGLIRRKDALAACGITHSARYAEQTITALPAAPVEALVEAAIPTRDRLPEKPGLKSYEQIPCLIFVNGEWEISVWNCEHLCWDDADGDDYRYDPKVPDLWLPLPYGEPLRAILALIGEKP